MNTHTQLNFVKKQLMEHGKISRNQCLKERITRLSGRILDLKNAGWELEGKNVKENGGTNYVYFLKSKPKVRKITLTPEGRAVETYE